MEKDKTPERMKELFWMKLVKIFRFWKKLEKKFIFENFFENLLKKV